MLERLALRYVERFATTEGKLVDYLTRKLRERGWAGEGAP
ncbi:RecX family transcriptional regulator, partial [Sphingomonas sanguinis]